MMSSLRRLSIPLLVPALLLFTGAAASQPTVFQPFGATAEWNTPLPADAPIASFSGNLIAEMEGWSAFDWPRLSADDWSAGVWVGSTDDPEYSIKQKGGCYLPPGLNPVSIPNEAKPTTSDDHEVLILDRANRKVVRLWDATKTGTPGSYSWSACNSSVYYSLSNGLHQEARGSNDQRNEGWRGVPGNLKTVTYDEVATGRLNHVIAIGVDNSAPCYFWPMVGDEGHSGDYACEGLMLRIRPTIDLEARGLTGGCLIIARTLQYYGAMIADTGGVAFNVELEQLSIEGRSERWADIGVTKDCMEDKIRFDDFQVISGGYDRPPT
jgi:hypothetical protein